MNIKAKNKTKNKKSKSESFVPTPYLKRIIAQAEKEFAEGKCEVAHSIEELREQLMS